MLINTMKGLNMSPNHLIFTPVILGKQLKLIKDGSEKTYILLSQLGVILISRQRWSPSALAWTPTSSLHEFRVQQGLETSK